MLKYGIKGQKKTFIGDKPLKKDMKKNLLKYEFWETADKYYSKLFSHVVVTDLKRIRTFIANSIFSNFNFSKSIIWLDIGSGDGATLSAIFESYKSFKKINIRLVVVEPSSKAIKMLKSNLNRYKNISIKIIQTKFKQSLLKKEKYDIITFLHSSYYIANSKKEFKKVYLKAYNSLKPNGVLLVQSIKSDSDFRKLETPPRAYNIYSCGDKTCDIFKSLWKHAFCKELKTRYDIADYLKKNLSAELNLELKQFYLFINQNPYLKFSDKEKSNFINKMKKLANKKYLLDFKDGVVFVRK